MGKPQPIPQHGKGAVMDHRSRVLVNQLVSEAQRERCTLQLGVNVTPLESLKRIEEKICITKDAPSFSRAHSENTTIKCAP